MAYIRANLLGGLTYGTFYDDLIEGSANVDTIRAGDGDDVINAGKGNDTIIGGEGADRIDGGGDIDTIDFSGAHVANEFNDGVSIDLYYGVGHWGEAEGDTYRSIENVTGTRYDDAIRGNAENNVLRGGGGDDIIAGGKGGDSLDGGEGIDTLSYIYLSNPNGPAPAQSTGVTINLATNTASGGDAEGDKIANFENVYGSTGKDMLTGSKANNVLYGNGDDDTIDGGAGNDDVEGGGGNDTLYGGRDNDMIIGGEGNDIMTGGIGSDHFVFNIIAGNQPGYDKVLDFEVGVDQLWFYEGFAGNDAGDLHMTQYGSNTVITYDTVPGALVLVGVDVDDLSAQDFFFY